MAEEDGRMTEDQLAAVEGRIGNRVVDRLPGSRTGEASSRADARTLLAEVRRLRRVIEDVQATLAGADPDAGADPEAIVEILRDRLIVEPDGPTVVLYLSLHTAEPTVGGPQTTHEVAYAGYARQRFTEDLPMTFREYPEHRPLVVTHYAIGTSAVGPGHVRMCGAVDPPMRLKGPDANLTLRMAMG